MMNHLKNIGSIAFTAMGMLFATAAAAQAPASAPVYHIYAGNTHAHTIFSMSHGAQYIHKPGYKHYMRTDSAGVSVSINTVLRPDWYKRQGLPSAHYALARANGYDFYITTDHSQEAGFHPTSPISAAWLATGHAASVATDSGFVAIRGFEYSENNGPGAKGHINVINTATYLNALESGIDIPYLYRWLDTVSANGDGPVVASFNHPGARQYDDWNYRDGKITDIITMLEVINSDTHIHYQGFINALDKGWKVSPVCGNDNHGLSGITRQRSRTFVLAGARTKTAILDGMKNRRTYASLESNIHCSYTVNGHIMGSTLSGGESFQFDIRISDPDTGDPNDKITRIDIVKDGGEVVKTYRPDPAYLVSWRPVIRDSRNKYFFIRVWNAGGGDGPRADPEKPVAWLAPVWTGR
ncbi:MAG TPA: hypothetical protein VFX43_12160 [Chitinophagaceae bacterium]|nr:hypothetical protein [Chitinophagaceae bacterium]